MGCAQSRLRSKVDVRDLESIVRTGDLILFSSKHTAANFTKCFTASTWDHCGLVVKFSSRHVFILEYAGAAWHDDGPARCRGSRPPLPVLP